MPYAAEENRGVQSRVSRKEKFWRIVAAVLLLGFAVAVSYYVWLSRTPEVGGRLNLKGTTDTKFFANDQLIGHSQVSFDLRELFGGRYHKPLAIELADFPTTAIAELVSGPGAQVLHSESIGGIGGASVDISGERILARRADGSLDQVFAFVFDWRPPNEPARRFLLPVRPRLVTVPSKNLFGQGGMSCTGTRNPFSKRILGHPAQESILTIDLAPVAAPNEFAEEIETKGLWEPGESR